MHLPSAERFRESVRHVQAYVRSEPGAHTSLMEAARRDPEGMTASLVALGAVLLDLAAGALSMGAEDMLDKVSERVVAAASGHSVSPLDATAGRRP